MFESLRSASKKHLGVILVDMQPGFLEDVDHDEVKTQIAAQIDVLEACAPSDIPIAILEYSGYGRTHERLRPYIEATPRHEYFTKRRNDGFTNDELEPSLRAWNVNSVCMMGVSAAFCVKSTAQSALNRGFEIVTARQLIASQTYRQREFKACIPWFQTNGAYSSNYQDVVQAIRT